MTKEEKYAQVQALGEKLKEKPNLYIADAGGLTVSQVNDLRRLCHEAGVEMKVVKNTLIKKAMDAAEGNYEGLYEVLKLQSSVFFVSGEELNAPAKVIKKFRQKSEMPILKGAYIEEAIFIGDNTLESLASLKSKNELIGEIITLLQSPAKNVISALQGSSGGKIHGLLEAIGNKES